MKTLTMLNAAKLGITEVEHRALLRVRDDLSSGRIPHASIEWFWGDTPKGNARFFNMTTWGAFGPEPGCGTIMCIGGLLQGYGCGGIDRASTAIFSGLFTPQVPFSISWDSLDARDAVRAIDHFLSGSGTSSWELALLDTRSNAKGAQA